MKKKQSYMYKRRYEEEGRRREYVTYGKRNKVTCTREDMRKKEEEENSNI